MTDIKLATAGNDIKIWDCAGYTSLKQFNPHSGAISSIDWSSDNGFLASASTAGDKVVLTYTKTSAYSSSEVALNEGRTCVALNTNSRYLLTGGPDTTISVFDLKKQKLVKTYKDHKAAITSVQFNWNDAYIASSSERGEIIVYNVVTGQGSSPLVAPKSQAVRQLQYSLFKKSLLGSASDDGAVNLWDANTRRLVHSFTNTHRAPCTGLAFSPINEMLLTSVGLDKRVVYYDVQGKTAVKTMMADQPLVSIDILHDGCTLAVGSTRGNVYIYDLRQGASPVRTFAAHKSSVQCLKFQNPAKTTKIESVTKPPQKTSSVTPRSSFQRNSERLMEGSSQSVASSVPSSSVVASSAPTPPGVAGSVPSLQGVANSANSVPSPSRSVSSAVESRFAKSDTELVNGNSPRRSIGDSEPRTRFQLPVESSTAFVGAGEGASAGASRTPEDASAIRTPGDASAIRMPGDASATQPFHMEFVKNMIEDAMDEVRDQMRRDILNLHVDMIKQFYTHQEEMKKLIQHYSVNEQLVAEVERLRFENEQLKKNY